jgi:phosphoribosylglycinamide formyltransferase-1
VSAPLRVAALISGSGSNLKVLLDAVRDGRLDAEVVHVISDRAEAGGLELAREAGVPTTVIDKAHSGPSNQDAATERLLSQLDPDLVLLTGYMRILGSSPVNAFRGRMINQHPSLLPRHKGLHTYRRALEAGDQEHGASVHFVTPELDDVPV